MDRMRLFFDPLKIIVFNFCFFFHLNFTAQQRRPSNGYFNKFDRTVLFQFETWIKVLIDFFTGYIKRISIIIHNLKNFQLNKKKLWIELAPNWSARSIYNTLAMHTIQDVQATWIASNDEIGSKQTMHIKNTYNGPMMEWYTMLRHKQTKEWIS